MGAPPIVALYGRVRVQCEHGKLWVETDDQPGRPADSIARELAQLMRTHPHPACCIRCSPADASQRIIAATLGR